MGSIRLRILKDRNPCTTPRPRTVAVGSIRLRILKVNAAKGALGIRSPVAVGSIRLRILKDQIDPQLPRDGLHGCSGLDPTEDTERCFRAWRA